FASADFQTWSFQVVRHVQHSGAEDVWAPALRAKASFVGQSGRLERLHGLRRGLVMDLHPELTAVSAGARAPGGSYSREPVDPELGGSMRWGVTNNLTLNAAANPDFSQVESDAGQINLDPRQAIFFPEKRPFFLDGIEQFATPNNLIYTRQIVRPVAAVKLTGRSLGTDLAVLSAVDAPVSSSTGHHPIFNLLRLQTDIGGGSQLGLAYTDRIDGGDYNQVADLDGRVVFGGVYAVVAQAAASRTRTDGKIATGPLWTLRFDRNGHRFGWRTYFGGVGDQFITQSGFIGRRGLVNANVVPNFTFYPKPGSLVQRVTTAVTLGESWDYQHFIHNQGVQNRALHLDVNSTLRGGWTVAAGWFLESYGYDPALFDGYYLGVPDGSGGIRYEPFVGQSEIDNNEGYVRIVTPAYTGFDANIFALYGNDENFSEWSSGRLLNIAASINARPTDQLRLSFTYNHQQVNRRTDGSLVLLNRIPRLKMEYQLARPLFIRLVGEYDASKQDSLRDNSRTEYPIYLADGNGGFARAGAVENNSFHAEALVAFTPTPGTVVYAGYGSTMADTESFSFRSLRRERDSFFAKVSYLFRL
ncbi:MAG TPA: DUF5916 domain-containing protein, partial [Gemmatimonadales bacterium]|nr:DUF5916 domain-containing protein [Gemmatimonadales bacterium]